MSSGRHCNSWRLQSGRLMPIIVGYEQEEEKHSNCWRCTERTQPAVRSFPSAQYSRFRFS